MMSNWNKFVVLHHFWQQLLFKVSAAAKHFYLRVVQSIHFGDTQRKYVCVQNIEDVEDVSSFIFHIFCGLHVLSNCKAFLRSDFYFY